MKKSMFSKLIAVVCVMALAFTAVFTGAVSAANATCTVTGDCYEPGSKDSFVMYTVRFSSSSQFVAGQFTVTAPSDLQLVDCSPAASSVNGYVPEVYLNIDNNRVLFAGFTESSDSDITPFTSLDLRLKFSPSTAVKDQAAGKTWQITVGSIQITDTNESAFTCSNANGTAHVHKYNGSTSTSGSVKTTHCSVAGCSAVKTEITGTAGLSTNNLAASKQARLAFTSDGDTVLVAMIPKATVNALGGTTYFVYKYKDDDADLKTATSVGTLNGDYYEFPCGRNGGIGRMSRDITGNFINVSGSTTISAEWKYSIKDYLTSVIGGNYTTEQKNYAKALWNYGYQTAKALVTDGQTSFTGDRDSFSPNTYTLSDWSLPSSKKAEDTGGTDRGWTVSKIAVTTGYKPKMNIKVSQTGTVTVAAYSAGDALVYKKSLSVTSGTAFTISDIPTKYLTGHIEISMSGSNRIISYSFGKYAKARASASDAAVFQAMMNYANYLGVAFG